MVYDVFDAKICQISATIINILEFDKQNITLSVFKIHFLVKLSNFLKKNGKKVLFIG